MKKAILAIIVVMVACGFFSAVSAQEFSLVPIVVVTQEGEKIVYSGNNEIVEQYYTIRIGKTTLGELRESSLIQSEIFGLWVRDATLYMRKEKGKNTLWNLEIFNRPSNKEEAEDFRKNPPDSWYDHRFYLKAVVKAEHLPVPLNNFVLKEYLPFIDRIVHYKEGGIKIFLADGVSFKVADKFAEKIRTCLIDSRTI